MDKFFGTLMAFLGLLMWLTVIVTATDGQYVGAAIIGVVAFALSSWAGKMLARAKHQEVEASLEEIEEGLWATLVGPQELLVRVGLEFYEGHEEKPGQKPSAESRRELKACNIQCPDIHTEVDALAVRTALWNVHVPCWNCGEEAMYDETKCVDCGKKLWQKPLRVHLENITAAGP